MSITISYISSIDIPTVAGEIWTHLQTSLVCNRNNRLSTAAWKQLRHQWTAAAFVMPAFLRDGICDGTMAGHPEFWVGRIPSMPKWCAKAQAPLGATLDLHQRVKGVLEICWGRLVLLHMILVAHLSRSCGGALIHRLRAMEVEDGMGNQPKFQYEKHLDFQVPTRARFFCSAKNVC